jgi:hypothetical protein
VSRLDFYAVAHGATPDEAFRTAVEVARNTFGTGGRTGSVLEKEGWVVVDTAPLPESEAIQITEDLLSDADPRFADTDSPAGAIPLTTGQWLFFGWSPY